MSSEPQPSSRCRLRAALLGAACAALLLPAAGCGKQGDPRPPLRQVPQRTDDLMVSQRGDEMLLELPYPKTTTAGMTLPPLDRLEVWVAVRPIPERLREPEPGGEAAAEELSEQPPPLTEEVMEGEAEPAEGDAEMADGEEGEPQTAEEAAAERERAERRERARRLRELRRPLDGPQFTAAAELRRTVAGPELANAVFGDRIVLRVPLPAPQSDDPEIHYVSVRTAVGEDVSPWSKQAVLTPRTPPPAPGSFRVEQKGNGIEVSWEAEEDPAVVGYNLYRRDARSRVFGGPVARPPRESSSFFDRTVTVGETYIYSVTSVVSYQPLVESAITEVREVDYRDRFAPPAPASAVALAEDGRVRVVWEGSDADDLAGYLVSRRRGEGDFEALFDDPRSGSEYLDDTVEAGETYTYRIVAVDLSGNESEPAEASTEAR